MLPRLAWPSNLSARSTAAAGEGTAADSEAPLTDLLTSSAAPFAQSQALAPRLTRLDLGHCSNLTDSGVAKLAALTALQALSLKDCVAVTDAGV